MCMSNVSVGVTTNSRLPKRPKTKVSAASNRTEMPASGSSSCRKAQTLVPAPGSRATFDVALPIFAGRPSAISAGIARMGLGVRAVPFEGWVGDKANRDALRACDAIFGCTDYHDGRMFLSRFAYYSLVPVMDMGLAIDVSDSDPPEIESMDGRVTVLGPENPCLVCAGLVDPEIARAEALKREHPDEYEKLKREAYVLGEGNPAPAVVTFTTEVACMAVNELIQRMTGFRPVEGSAANRVRKFHLCEDRRPGYRPRTGCRICDDDGLWGRGDVDPFIGRVS